MHLIWKRPDGFHKSTPDDFTVLDIDSSSRIWLHKKIGRTIRSESREDGKMKKPHGASTSWSIYSDKRLPSGIVLSIPAMKIPSKIPSKLFCCNF